MGKHDGSESVLCVPNSEVDRWFGSRRGFVRPLNPSEIELALAERGEFRPWTDELEEDESWRQLIPYGLLTNAGGIFAYERGAGHINPEDAADAHASPHHSLRRALWREVVEEIRPDDTPSGNMDLLGFLILDDTPVDRVHLGIVYGVPLDSRQVAPAPEVVPLGWWHHAGPAAGIDPADWEGWSRVIIEALGRDLRASAEAGRVSA
jgi:predicted NUDIX family phosphoesterase